MIECSLPLYALISEINQFTDCSDDITEWGEWIVSYCVDCAIGGKKADPLKKLTEIAGQDFAAMIMEEYARDFRLIELTVETHRDFIVDYHVTLLGVIFAGH